MNNNDKYMAYNRRKYESKQTGIWEDAETLIGVLIAAVIVWVPIIWFLTWLL